MQRALITNDSMPSLGEATWAEIEEVRRRLGDELVEVPSVEEAAQRFVSIFVEAFPTTVLARIFGVLPLRLLPEADRTIATSTAERIGSRNLLREETPTLSLLGTAGREPEWNDRTRSVGHRAIPLVNRAFVEGAPMLARLLADLQVDFASLDDGRPATSRRLAGGTNQRFYVADAATAKDDRGRSIIPSTDFVAKHGVRTVFGMGGSYFEGTLVVAIIFAAEKVELLAADRFPTLISNFKMSTTECVQSGRIFVRP